MITFRDYWSKLMKLNEKQRKIKFPLFFNGFLCFSLIFIKKSWNSTKNIFSIFWRFFLTLNKNIFSLIFSIPIQNFPKNPKIILRTPCDHFEDAKNTKSKFFYTKSRILVTFGDVLGITTLKSMLRERRYFFVTFLICDDVLSLSLI